VNLNTVSPATAPPPLPLRPGRCPCSQARPAPLCQVAQVCAHPAPAPRAVHAPQGGAGTSMVLFLLWGMGGWEWLCFMWSRGVEECCRGWTGCCEGLRGVESTGLMVVFGTVW